MDKAVLGAGEGYVAGRRPIGYKITKSTKVPI